MPKTRITKTLSLERGVAVAIEKLAKHEHRSFTKTVEILLENALQRRQEQPSPEAQT